MPIQPHDYALVIGIDDYPNFRSLAGAKNDAEAFRDWLLDIDHGGGLPEENHRLILSNLDPASPGFDEIDVKLLELWNIISQKPPSELRRFYFYFGGHGIGLGSDKVGLCLAKWSKVRRRWALAAEEYVSLIKESGKFEEVFFFLDCCRLPTRSASGFSPSIEWIRPAEDARQSRSFIAYATQFQDAAFEIEMGTLEEDEIKLVQGYFTTALLAGLRGGAARPEGGVALKDLKEYLEVETFSLANKDNVKQQPVIRTEFPEQNNVFFGSAVPEKNVIINFVNGRVGPIRLEDPETNLIREGEVNSGPWDLTLYKGNHVLIDLSTGEMKLIRFEPSNTLQHVEF